ncbi:hypothetical protein FS837_000946 [Tulasnella sp. UAMH 9824]|nr:hypothetical protein FS837_000946 [Tulasnella sp. UAMH 9824]
MGPSRFEEALRKADASIRPNPPSSSFNQDFDPDRVRSPPRKRPAVPGSFPEGSPLREDSPEPVGDISMEEVEAELDLPELSIEAQLEALRARGAPDLRRDDAVVHDVDMNAAPDQAQEVVRFFQEQSRKQPQVHTVQEALENIGMQKGSVTWSGFSASPHQIVGVPWMLNKERNHREMGGILADDMGLGKTVQAIALVVITQLERGDDGQYPGPYQTLIVAPAALLNQFLHFLTLLLKMGKQKSVAKISL